MSGDFHHRPLHHASAYRISSSSAMEYRRTSHQSSSSYASHRRANSMVSSASKPYRRATRASSSSLIVNLLSTHSLFILTKVYHTSPALSIGKMKKIYFLRGIKKERLKDNCQTILTSRRAAIVRTF